MAEQEKFTKKEIMQEFLNVMVEDLSKWVHEANKTIGAFHSSAAAVSRLIVAGLRRMNDSITDLRNRVHTIYLTYMDIEREYELKPLSVEYFMEYSGKVAEILALIQDIKEVANAYSNYIERSQQENVNVAEYIRPQHQKSIEFLQTLTEKSFIDLLERGNLSGM